MPSPPTKNSTYPTFDALLFEPDAVSPEIAYSRMYLKLIKFFDWRQAVDPANLASEVIHRLLHNLAQGHTLNTDRPWAYVFGIALNVYREDLRQRTKQRLVSLDSNPNLGQLVSLFDLEAVDHERKLQILEECISELPAIDQHLIRSYLLYSKEDTDKLITELGISRNSFWIRAHRIRQRLKIKMMRKMEHV